MKKKNLGLIIMQNCKKLGSDVDGCLKQIQKTDESFIIPINETRFNNGEGKIVLEESVRAKDVYLISDVGNYNCTYNMYGYQNITGPDEHFQDIKRVISACAGSAEKITVIMPLLYEARQHRRKGRESLDCALSLQELERLGVNNIITFDAHDPNVQNAIPCLSFINLYPTLVMLNSFLDNEKIDTNNMLVIAPDTGAMDRARYYADILNCDAGMFYKRRDLSVVVDGKNPIVAHEYIGKDVENKDIIVVDDMIASGGSILDVVEQLKNRKAKNIYIFCTFALFTQGTDKFDDYYKDKLFTKIYSTNLSYIPETIQKKDWFVPVNCSHFLAEILDRINSEESISPLMNGKHIIIEKLKKINEKNN